MGSKVKISLGLLTAGTIISGLLVYNTKFEKNIIVKQKYTIVSNNNEIFKMNRYIWYRTFDPTEKWVKIQENEKNRIKGWGLRIPMLNIYPNITEIVEIREIK